MRTKTQYILDCVSVCSVVSDSLWPRELWPARLLCPWDVPGKNTGVGCHFLLQGIFLTQRWNLHLLHLLHWQSDSLPLSLLGRCILDGNSSIHTLCILSHEDSPGGSDSKESACNVEDLGSIPGSGRPPGEGNGYPLHCILLGESHGQRSLAGYSLWGCRVGHDWATFTFHSWGYQVVGGRGRILFLCAPISAQLSAQTRGER